MVKAGASGGGGGGGTNKKDTKPKQVVNKKDKETNDAMTSEGESEDESDE